MPAPSASAGKLDAMGDSHVVNVWVVDLQSRVITINIAKELFLPESMHVLTSGVVG